MKILTNDNNEYFGLVSDYKNGNAFREAIVADGAEGKIAIIATIHMRPLTDHELSEEGDYSTYAPGHWIPVDVPCETSDVFYHAVETDIPVVEEVIDTNGIEGVYLGDNLSKEKEFTPYIEGFEFRDSDGTIDDGLNFNTEHNQQRTEEIKEEE